ncbi:Recombinase (RecA) and ATPase domain of putativeATP-dependent protease [Giardia duodenalis assemblage B]|uniref:Recombinase (RecA) and ATPase domain of putativeATP-dependent protease n=1 Tax=Giardia duodenalis assemblage B TaxID=1394984 RepID=A0A132NML2_GIAIN|nr:Recombinase (RecA) and ATPase domain of putativeATP-dependent protease [Giardia intestinalis assemblage B]
MPQSPRPLANAQAETPPSRRRLPVSYPEMGCASNGLQSALMREQTHAEKTGMCTRPSPQEALSLLDRGPQAIQAAQHD